MNTKEILTIIALVVLGLCLLCNLANMVMKSGDKEKKQCDKICISFIFLAIILLTVSQLLPEEEKLEFEGTYDDVDTSSCPPCDCANPNCEWECNSFSPDECNYSCPIPNKPGELYACGGTGWCTSEDSDKNGKYPGGCDDYIQTKIQTCINKKEDGEYSSYFCKNDLKCYKHKEHAPPTGCPGSDNNCICNGAGSKDNCPESVCACDGHLGTQIKNCLEKKDSNGNYSSYWCPNDNGCHLHGSWTTNKGCPGSNKCICNGCPSSQCACNSPDDPCYTNYDNELAQCAQCTGTPTGIKDGNDVSMCGCDFTACKKPFCPACTCDAPTLWPVSGCGDYCGMSCDGVCCGVPHQ